MTKFRSMTKRAEEEDMSQNQFLPWRGTHPPSTSDGSVYGIVLHWSRCVSTLSRGAHWCLALKWSEMFPAGDRRDLQNKCASGGMFQNKLGRRYVKEVKS